MAVPQLVRFDRYAQLEGGLDFVSSEAPFLVNRGGLNAVTGWLANGYWSVCYDPITTGWTACFTQPTTGWSALFAPPVTSWSDCAG